MSDIKRCDILFLIRSMGRGGAERQLSLLARALHARGMNIVVAVFYGGGALEHDLHVSGVEVLDLRKSGRWSNLKTIRRLLDFVRVRRPRIMHSYLVVPNVCALAMAPWLRKHGCIVVCGVRTALKNAWKYHPLAGSAGIFQPLLMSRAGAIISNSSAALRSLELRNASVKKFVIPNGVEHTSYAYSEASRAFYRESWRVPENAAVIGLVARLDPQKNHILAIEAMREVAADREAFLVCIGDGSEAYKKTLQAYARKVGIAKRILWIGPASDMAAIYSALDVVCLCSLIEGFPNVLAEAMCVGLPCVTTDVGDAAAIVGDCGWIVPSGDPRALASGLLDACKALPSWDPGRPRARIVENFSVEALVDRTLAALRPFLAEVSA